MAVAVAPATSGCQGLRSVAGGDSANEPAIAKLSSDTRISSATPERAALAAGVRREPAPVAKIGRSVAGNSGDFAESHPRSPSPQQVATGRKTKEAPRSVDKASVAKVASRKPSRAVRQIGFESESHVPSTVADNESEGTTSARRWSSRAPAIDESTTRMSDADETPEVGSTETVLAALEEAADMGSETVADTEAVPGDVGETTESSARSADGASRRLSDRLKIPEELPGAAVPPLRLPKFNPDDPADRRRAIDGLFPELPSETLGLSKDNPQTLADFEAVAIANNPVVTQAMADVENANGRAVQAGLYPNPVIGYQGDTIGSGGTANYHGVFIQQQIKTRNKLGLAQYAARYDISNSQLRLRRARVEVLTGVRTAYFRVMTARESMKIYEALVRFTDQAYRIQVEQLKGGQAAAYEPMQLRSLSTIARAEFAKARTRYDGAWRQLAAAVSVPELPVGDIPDNADTPIPRVKYDEALAFMLGTHPDIAAASNSVMQAHTNLELACVTPFPDVNFYTAIQRDFTDPNVRRHTFNMQVGLPVPIWDRNQGNIQSAQATVVRTSHESTRLRNDLVTKLADAFQRFDSADIVVTTYRDQVIPDLSRVYRSVYERHQQEPDVVGFGDIIVAQQTLLQAITQYAVALGDRWTAFVEILSLMQVEDLQQLPSTSSGVETPAP